MNKPQPKLEVTMTSEAPRGVLSDGTQYTTKINLYVTVDATYIDRIKGKKRTYKKMDDFYGTTPMDCLINAVEHANKQLAKLAAKDRNGEPWIVDQPTVTNATANHDNPAYIVFRIQ